MYYRGHWDGSAGKAALKPWQPEFHPWHPSKSGIPLGCPFLQVQDGLGIYMGMLVYISITLSINGQSLHWALICHVWLPSLISQLYDKITVKRRKDLIWSHWEEMQVIQCSPIIDPSLSGLYSLLKGGWSDKLYISFLETSSLPPDTDKENSTTFFPQ